MPEAAVTMHNIPVINLFVFVLLFVHILCCELLYHYYNNESIIITTQHLI